MQNNPQVSVSNNPFDIFVVGARKGFHIAIHNLMPNVVMAYVIAEVLNLPGAMQLIGTVFAPVMGLSGLPGEAVTVLLTVWLSSSAGTGRCYQPAGKRRADRGRHHDLAPAIFLMGSQLQYMGRLPGVSDVPKKYWPLLMLTSIMNSVIAMLVKRIIA